MQFFSSTSSIFIYVVVISTVVYLHVKAWTILFKKESSFASRMIWLLITFLLPIVGALLCIGNYTLGKQGQANIKHS